MRELSRVEKLAYVGASAGLGALLLSACSQESVEQIRQMVAADQEGTDRSLACIGEKDKQTPEQALLCSRFKSAGKIALVGYHVDTELLQKIAKDAQDKTNQTFGTNVTFTAVPANEALTYLLDTKSPSCINNDYPVSLSAAKVMDDELEQYDAIIGTDGLDDCNASAAGWHIASEGQFAEVVAVTEEYQNISTVVHEVGHMFGLGHAGQFNIEGDYVPYILSVEDVATYDLSNIFNTSAFEAYGDGCNIMGSEANYCLQLNDMQDYDEKSAQYPFYINPIQQSMLDWSDEYKSVYVTPLEKGNSTQLNTGEEIGIATLQLDEPILFDGFAGGTDGTFDKISFTANCGTDKYKWAHRCVDMYLHNRSSTAYIGSLTTFAKDHDTTTTIKIHNQSAVIKIKNGKITVNVTK